MRTLTKGMTQRLAWVLGGLLLAAQLPAHAAVEYIHTDSLGTPVAITDSDGNVIQTSEYEPYGKLLNRPLTDSPGYTGHETDATTGMTYMQQRYYDSQLGRFLSVDPVASREGGDNFNRYGYAAENPYRFKDPDGRETGAGYATGAYTMSGPSVDAAESSNTTAIAAAVVYTGGLAEAGGVADAVVTVGRQLIGNLARDAAPEVRKGTAGGDRAGKPFTRAGKQEVIRQNREANGGHTKCEGCLVRTTPAQQSQKGVPTPPNETRVDHMIPQSKGGDGSPSNGQVLCSKCNLDKSNQTGWIAPKDRVGQ